MKIIKNVNFFIKSLQVLKKYLPLQSQSKDMVVLQNWNGVIAQLVEQRTENPCVPGSIPGDTTENPSQCILRGVLSIYDQYGRL